LNFLLEIIFSSGFSNFQRMFYFSSGRFGISRWKIFFLQFFNFPAEF